jgi:hypothetical protein
LTFKNLHLISYGHKGKYERAARRLVSEARQSGVFASAHSYNFKDFSKNRREWRIQASDLDYIHGNSFAGGSYLWKPLLIASILNNLQSKDFLVYVDAGSEINFHKAAKNNLAKFIEHADTHDIACVRQNVSVISQSRASLQALFDDPSRFQDRHSPMASVLVIKNSEGGQAVVGEWLRLCRLQPTLFLEDPPLTEKQNPEFVAHKYDQALLAVALANKSVPLLCTRIDRFANPIWSDQLYLWANSKTRLKVRAEFGKRPFAFSREWRREGREYFFWGSRNRSGLPLHRPGFYGFCVRLVKISMWLLLRKLLSLKESLFGVDGAASRRNVIKI